MHNLVSYTFQIVGLLLLIVGYRRNDKKLMLIAALAIWFGGSLDNILINGENFATGFMEGFNGKPEK
jgi:hypothetical protein